uniref:Uncharacterized protein n=1 Tax=Pycnococcus provasolii TaxID=41880 RepID=A0A7S2YUR6_9CHLO|mmetsp:Transcript_1401/g.3347  ORF Transcript_1401/g.3347 Transcript_1401/m.3347 type:complete len:103 (+) Transcript_1401:82-390(+)
MNAAARVSIKSTKRDVRVAGAGGIFGQERVLGESIFVKPGPKYAARWSKNSEVKKINGNVFGGVVERGMETQPKGSEGTDLTKVAPAVAAVLAVFVGYQIPH